MACERDVSIIRKYIQVTGVGNHNNAIKTEDNSSLPPARLLDPATARHKDMWKGEEGGLCLMRYLGWVEMGYV